MISIPARRTLRAHPGLSRGASDRKLMRVYRQGHDETRPGIVQRRLSRLGERDFGLAEGPVEPRRQRFESAFSTVAPHQMRRPGGASR